MLCAAVDGRLEGKVEPTRAIPLWPHTDTAGFGVSSFPVSVLDIPGFFLIYTVLYTRTNRTVAEEACRLYYEY